MITNKKKKKLDGHLLWGGLSCVRAFGGLIAPSEVWWHGAFVFLPFAFGVVLFFAFSFGVFAFVALGFSYFFLLLLVFLFFFAFAFGGCAFVALGFSHLLLLLLVVVYLLRLVFLIYCFCSCGSMVRKPHRRPKPLFPWLEKPNRSVNPNPLPNPLAPNPHPDPMPNR